MPFDFQLPGRERRLPTMGGGSPPAHALEMDAFDATMPAEEESYRVLSPDDVMPDSSGRWEQLIAAAKGSGRRLRPKQQDAYDQAQTEMGPFTKKDMKRQRRAIADQDAIDAGLPTRRERIAGEFGDMFAGMAHGAAAATGMPAWQRASRQVAADREAANAMNAAERKSRLATLASLGKSQADEAETRADLLTDPVVEFEGQRMPRAAADNILNRRLRERIAGQTNERLAGAAEAQDEDRDRRLDIAERGVDATERRLQDTREYRERVLALRESGMSKIEAHREAMRGLADRRVKVAEKVAGGGGGAGGAGMKRTDVRATQGQASSNLWREYERGDRETPPTPEDIDAETRRLLGVQDDLLMLDDDPFGDIGLDDEFEDGF